MNYFQSTGKVKISMFLSLLRQIIILIPCIIIIPKFLGLTGIWLAGPVSDMIALVITIVMFIKYSKELWTSEEDLNNVVAG